jgi:outer membrane murein-binding lipoprotein Lpp
MNMPAPEKNYELTRNNIGFISERMETYDRPAVAQPSSKWSLDLHTIVTILANLVLAGSFLFTHFAKIDIQAVEQSKIEAKVDALGEKMTDLRVEVGTLVQEIKDKAKDTK